MTPFGLRGNIPQIPQVVWQRLVISGNEAVPLNDGLPFLLTCFFEEFPIGSAAGILSGEAVVTTGCADGGCHVLIHHYGAFPGQSIEVGTQVFPFALGEIVEHLRIHVIGDKEDDVRSFLVGGMEETGKAGKDKEKV